MIEAEGGRGFIVQVDLRQPTVSVEPMFETIDRELKQRGEIGLDILVNNAGQLVPGTVDTLTGSQFDEAFAIDVKAPLFIAQAVLSRLRDGQGCARSLQLRHWRNSSGHAGSR